MVRGLVVPSPCTQGEIRMTLGSCPFSLWEKVRMRSCTCPFSLWEKVRMRAATSQIHTVPRSSKQIDASKSSNIAMRQKMTQIRATSTRTIAIFDAKSDVESVERRAKHGNGSYRKRQRIRASLAIPPPTEESLVHHSFSVLSSSNLFRSVNVFFEINAGIGTGGTP